MIQVSIIVPVYNVEASLPRCLDSLIGQTLENIEIILVDDGSKDNSGTICDEYATNDPRITTIHIANSGPARARNLGIERAKGEYIGFVDSDDYVDEDMFRQLYNVAHEADIAMCNYYTVRAGDIKESHLHYPAHLVGQESIRNYLLRRYYTGETAGLYSLWNKIFRCDMIMKNQVIFDEELYRAEDAWFVYDSLRSARSFRFINHPLYYYVQNPESIMHSVLPDQYERWKYNRQKLITDNMEYGFQVDNNKFYGGMLYKLAVYCRDLIESGAKDKVKMILSDPFYIENSCYVRGLPIHIRLIHLLGRKTPRLAMLLLRIWSLTGK